MIRRHSHALTVFAVLLAVVAQSGCAKIMGNLRRDLDDSDPYSPPTVGGRWSERGFLSENMPESGPGGDRYDIVGHSERGPASLRADGQVSSDSWISGEQQENNRRDLGREVESVNPDRAVSFSNTPNLPPATRRLYKNGNRATRADFVDESPNEASLWASDGQINYYFTKNKIRGLGDIVTVNLEAEAVRDVALEVRRTLTPVEKDRELLLAEMRLKSQLMGPAARGRDGLPSSSAAPERAPAADGTPGAAAKPPGEDASSDAVTPADIDVSKSLALKPGEPMLAEIIDRFPNGNYKVRGTKKVPYKNGTPRLVTMVGVVKASDIADDDTVNSGKLYEYRLEAIR